MNPPDHVVSIHPYFKVHPGKMEAVRALLPAFGNSGSRSPATTRPISCRNAE
jgi:hypothetical protein